MIDHVASSLRASERTLLVTHEQPDGDALGTTLALGTALESLGQSVTLTCVDEVPPPFRFLPGIERFQRDCLLGSYDTIVTIDCGDLKRTGYGRRLRSLVGAQQRIVNIDHHQRNDLHKLAHLNYVDPDASSAAELVYPLIEALGAKVSADIATCLLTGLYNDTGGFKHSNTTFRVLSQAAALLARGARLRLINHHTHNYRSVPALRLWGVALSRIQHHPQLGLVTSVITQADFAACAAFPEDLAGCVNLINSVPGAAATILLAELPGGRIKASVRTERSTINVAALAGLFGGGGLKKAAGFSFPGRFEFDGSRWTIAGADAAQLRFSLPVPAETLPLARQPLTVDV